MWGAEFRFEARSSVTRDKKPVTAPLRGGTGCRSEASRFMPPARSPVPGPSRSSQHRDELSGPAACACYGTFSRAWRCRLAQLTGGSTSDGRRGFRDSDQRISHDENETLHCRTCRSRICGKAICCERTVVRDRYTKQHERAPRCTGTARHIWKFRTGCRDGYRAVDRNIQPALRRCDQFSPHLEKHESSGQAVTARRPHAAGARSFCPGTAASNSRV